MFSVPWYPVINPQCIIFCDIRVYHFSENTIWIPKYAKRLFKNGQMINNWPDLLVFPVFPHLRLHEFSTRLPITMYSPNDPYSPWYLVTCFKITSTTNKRKMVTGIQKVIKRLVSVSAHCKFRNRLAQSCKGGNCELFVECERLTSKTCRVE